jgi:hypothetical protein
MIVARQTRSIRLRALQCILIALSAVVLHIVVGIEAFYGTWLLFPHITVVDEH